MVDDSERPGASEPGAAAGHVKLRDGTLVTVRPIRPDDQAALQRMHSRLSQRSVYHRFFEWMPRLNDRLARYFTHLDGVNRRALVALDPEAPGELIAVVRYDRDPGSGRAEYAAVVEDLWQGRGIGTLLTQQLLHDARENGISRMYALVLHDNEQMLTLLEHLGLPYATSHEQGAVRLELDLQ